MTTVTTQNGIKFYGSVVNVKRNIYWIKSTEKYSDGIFYEWIDAKNAGYFRKCNKSGSVPVNKNINTAIHIAIMEYNKEQKQPTTSHFNFKAFLMCLMCLVFVSPTIYQNKHLSLQSLQSLDYLSNIQEYGKNLTNDLSPKVMDILSNATVYGKNITNEVSLQAIDILSKVKVYGKNITNEVSLQARDILSKANVYGKNITNEVSLQATDILSNSRVYGKNVTNELLLQAIDILSNVTLYGKNVTNELSLQARYNLSNATVYSKNITNELSLQVIDNVFNTYDSVKMYSKNKKDNLTQQTNNVLSIIHNYVVKSADYVKSTFYYTINLIEQIWRHGIYIVLSMIIIIMTCGLVITMNEV